FFNQSQHTPKPPLDKEDSTLDEILDDLFKIGAENIRKMEHEVPNRLKKILMLALQSIKEEVQVEDIKVDDYHDVDHSKTNEALQWSLSRDPFLVLLEPIDQSNFMK
ncbi:hypothetical protein Tco_1409362, partial [Tanacetum coccineum]